MAESLWKQVVKTSASFASLHIGRLYERQNCLLQSLHVAFLAVVSPGSSVKGMIVLLLKHVHLQKDVAAERAGLVMSLVRVRNNLTGTQSWSYQGQPNKKDL